MVIMPVLTIEQKQAVEMQSLMFFRKNMSKV